MKAPTQEEIKNAECFWLKLGEACQARGAEMVRRWDDMPVENREATAMALREWAEEHAEWERIGAAL